MHSSPHSFLSAFSFLAQQDFFSLLQQDFFFSTLQQAAFSAPLAACSGVQWFATATEAINPDRNITVISFFIIFDVFVIKLDGRVSKSAFFSDLFQK